MFIRRYKFRILLLVIIFTFIFSLTFSLAANESVYVWSNDSTPTSSITTENKTGNFLGLKSPSVVLIEQKTGKILYEHNSHEKLRPASVTKVMTLLLIMESLDSGKISLDTQIPCSEKASKMGGSQIWLDTTETLSVNEMLKAIAVVSANDCSVAMAEYLYGSEELFVEQMNKRAKELGMNDTTFKNCHGIDEDGHFTSSYDIALMSRELLNNHPIITNYTTIWMDNLRNGKSELVNTNKLIRNYAGATGLKTGSTSVALFNLSASATRNDLSLIAVIMKAESSNVRFAEAKKLLDYGFSNYEYKAFAKKGDIFKNINVNKGIFSNVNVIFDKESGALVSKGQASNLSTDISLDETINAPFEVSQVLGKVTFTLDGNIVRRV